MKKNNIAEMFNGIAPKYDKINNTLSLGIDKKWRKKTIKKLTSLNTDKILDISAGTGDFTIELTKLKHCNIIAADPATEMLKIAQQKFKEKNLTIEILLCNAEEMPFMNNSFDLVTCAFGVRNFSNLEIGLKEMHRVLNTNGHIAILEFGMPKRWLWRNIYKLYFNVFLPEIGGKMSKNKAAYKYLNRTVNNFPFGKKFEKILANAGFEKKNTYKLSGGIVFIYIFYKN